MGGESVEEKKTRIWEWKGILNELENLHPFGRPGVGDEGAKC